MAPSSEAHSAGHSPNGNNHSVASGLIAHLVSAAPLRTKRASDELAATLEELGADPCVVAAAKRT